MVIAFWGRFSVHCCEYTGVPAPASNNRIAEALKMNPFMLLQDFMKFTPLLLNPLKAGIVAYVNRYPYSSLEESRLFTGIVFGLLFLQVDNQDRLLKFFGCYFLRFLINLYAVNPATPAPKSTNVEGSGTSGRPPPLALLSPNAKKVTARNEKIAKMLRFMIKLFSVISSFYKIVLFLILLRFARSIQKSFLLPILSSIREAQANVP
jgi:hypothetical protein